ISWKPAPFGPSVRLRRHSTGSAAIRFGSIGSLLPALWNTRVSGSMMRGKRNILRLHPGAMPLRLVPVSPIPGLEPSGALGANGRGDRELRYIEIYRREGYFASGPAAAGGGERGLCLMELGRKR